MTKLLGLTGGIASGKTTISNYFRSLNIPLIDADLLARKVVRGGEPVVKKIAEVFGPEVLSADGEIDRVVLGKLIFDSAEKRKTLDDIVQPRIRSAIRAEIASYLKDKPRLIVLDLPLLYEHGYEDKVDEVMVVYVDAETQKERLLNRNQELSEKDAVNRINSQMALSEKAERADVVVDNNGTIEASISQVREWLRVNFGDELFK